MGGWKEPEEQREEGGVTSKGRKEAGVSASQGLGTLKPKPGYRRCPLPTLSPACVILRKAAR